MQGGKKGQRCGMGEDRCVWGRGDRPLPYQGPGLGGAWMEVGLCLTTGGIHLMTATGRAGTATAKQCSHVTSHFITTLLNNGNSAFNYHCNSRTAIIHYQYIIL